VGKLEAVGLVKKFRRNAVVDGADIRSETGEVIGFLGPNGAGKTTTFHMIAGFIRPDWGRILLNGEDITRLPMHERGRKGISYLPQEPSIFKRLSVEDNVRAVLELFYRDKMELESRLSELLEEFGLSKIAKKPATQISGGERRRVEITRTLATRPSFILFDEPFAGIDPISIAELQHMIKGLKTRGIGIIISDHNVRDTLSVTDRAYIIHKGKVIAAGTPAQITADPTTREVFFGQEWGGTPG
jgi:lipopolysaccharide export system ATP-binding protein